MTRSAEGRRLKVQITVAVIGAAAVVGAAVIANAGDWFRAAPAPADTVAGRPGARSADESLEELIQLLNGRADRLVAAMNAEYQRVADSLQALGWSPRAPERLADLVATRELFDRLHRQHIEALRSGQLAVAHEVLQDIHYLLWVRADFLRRVYHTPGTFYSGGTEPGPRKYAERYPGSRDDRLVAELPDVRTAVWPGWRWKDLMLDTDREFRIRGAVAALAVRVGIARPPGPRPPSPR